MIADDNEAILAAVAETLRAAGVEVVGICRSGAELLRALELVAPDALVLDLRLGPDNGIRVASSAIELAPPLAVIIHTSFAGPRVVRAAFGVGVRAVVLKRPSSERLLRALAEATAGRTYVDPEIRQPLRASPGLA